jgi:hypothetical protein
MEDAGMKKFVCTYTNGSGKLTVGKEYEIVQHIMGDCYAIVNDLGNVMWVTRKNGGVK